MAAASDATEVGYNAVRVAIDCGARTQARERSIYERVISLNKSDIRILAQSAKH